MSDTLLIIWIQFCLIASFLFNVSGLIHTVHTTRNIYSECDPTIILASINLLYGMSMFCSSSISNSKMSTISIGTLLLNVLAIPLWYIYGNAFLIIIPLSSLIFAVSFMGEMRYIINKYL